MKIFLRIGRNAIFSFGLNLGLKIANVFAFIVIGRLYGTGLSGVFSLATTYLLIFSTISVGLDELVTRQVTRNHAQARVYLGSYSLIRTIFNLGLYILIFFLIRYIFRYPVEMQWVILVFGACLFPDGLHNVGQAILASYERFDIPFFNASIVSLLKVVISFIVLKLGYGLIAISLVWFACSWLGALVVIGFAIRQVGGIVINKQLFTMMRINQIFFSYPFVLMSVLSTLEFQADVVLLSLIRSENELGLYSSTTTFLAAIMLVPQAYRAAIYPIMVLSQSRNSDLTQQLYRISWIVLGALAFPIVIGINLLSPNLLQFVFGERFLIAAPTLRVISWSLVFTFLNVPNIRILLVHERQKQLPGIIGFGLVINLVLNWFLIPYYGILALAISRVISECTIFLLCSRSAGEFIDYRSRAKDLSRPFIASAIMFILVWPLRDDTIWLPILVGILGYGVTIWFLKPFSSKDFGIISKIFDEVN